VAPSSWIARQLRQGHSLRDALRQTVAAVELFPRQLVGPAAAAVGRIVAAVELVGRQLVGPAAAATVGRTVADVEPAVPRQLVGRQLETMK
jgi:hypothetical protein